MPPTLPTWYVHPTTPRVYHGVHCPGCQHSMYAGLRRRVGEEALGSNQEGSPGWEEDSAHRALLPVMIGG